MVPLSVNLEAFCSPTLREELDLPYVGSHLIRGIAGDVYVCNGQARLFAEGRGKSRVSSQSHYLELILFAL